MCHKTNARVHPQCKLHTKRRKVSKQYAAALSTDFSVTSATQTNVRQVARHCVPFQVSHYWHPYSNPLHWSPHIRRSPKWCKPSRLNPRLIGDHVEHFSQHRNPQFRLLLPFKSLQPWPKIPNNYAIFGHLCQSYKHHFLDNRNCARVTFFYYVRKFSCGLDYGSEHSTTELFHYGLKTAHQRKREKGLWAKQSTDHRRRFSFWVSHAYETTSESVTLDFVSIFATYINKQRLKRSAVCLLHSKHQPSIGV